MTEVEKVEKDPDTGKRVKTKVSFTYNRCKKMHELADILHCEINAKICIAGS